MGRRGQKSVEERRRFYDTIAPEFDGIMNQYDLKRRQWAIFDQLLDQKVSDLRECRLLDVGC
jgi:hypothetical protein